MCAVAGSSGSAKFSRRFTAGQAGSGTRTVGGLQFAGGEVMMFGPTGHFVRRSLHHA